MSRVERIEFDIPDDRPLELADVAAQLIIKGYPNADPIDTFRKIEAQLERENNA